MRTKFSPVTLGDAEFKRTVGAFFLTDASYKERLRLPRHAHERSAISLLIEGRFTQTYNTRTIFECGSLDVLIEPGGAVHANFFPAGGRVFILEIDQERLQRLGGVANALAIPRLMSGDRLRRVALRLYRECRATDSAAALLIEGLALELLALTVREKTELRDGIVPAWLPGVRDRLEAEFLQGLSLTVLAEGVARHPVYVARAFRKFYGCSPGEFARRLQVELAADLLRNTDAAASSIALEAGFADQSHFTRVFKRQIGETPTRFRSAARRSRRT
jgi:AraC family transcriptional regulator